jgi:hypothetical protein
MWPFSHASAPPERVDDRIRNRDILYEDRTRRARTRWTRTLILFLRVLALVCLGRGLLEWSHILGFVGPEDAFEASSATAQVLSSLHAVLNCVASVGLWLTSAWGAVLWLTVTIFEVAAPYAAGRRAFGFTLADVALTALAAIYILLTWAAARERTRDR